MAREFCHEYMKVCEENRVEVQESVIAALQRCCCGSSGDPCSCASSRRPRSLKFSSCALLEKTCTVLGRLLAADHAFTEVSFADCTLPERGLRDLLEGMAVNTACQSLDLKGNNIRAHGAEALGRMLRQNTTLKRLCLEWNSIGALEQPFAVFVDGLAANTSLTGIDLRNNQITHEGAAELACALKRNPNLRNIDLRWNNVGLIGGRALLEALQQGAGSVEHLDLTGNNVPNDLMLCIEGALHHNRERRQLANEYCRRTRAVTAELRQTKREKALEMEDLISRHGEKEARMHKCHKETSRKVCQLQQALDERTTTFNSVVSKLSLVESELALSERKLKDTEILLRREREDRELLARHSQQEVQHLREEASGTTEKFRRELADVIEKNKELEKTVAELQLKCQQLQTQLHEAREEITHLQADKKMAKAHSDERHQVEKQAHAQRLAEMTERKNKEIEQTKNDCAQKEQLLQEHMTKQSQRELEYQQQINDLKAAITKGKLAAEEQLSSYKQRAVAEQNIVVRQLEETVHNVTSAKDEIQNLYSKANLTIVDLQSRNNSLLSDLEVARKKIQGLELDAANRRSQSQLEVEKAKESVVAKLAEAELDAQRRVDETTMQVKKLQKRLSERAEQEEEAIRAKDAEIRKLREKILTLEAEKACMHEENARRAVVLQAAVRTFVQPYGSCSPSPTPGST